MTAETIVALKSKEVDYSMSRLWEHFGDFTAIPRKTGIEQEVREHVIHWAKERKSSREVDKRGNVLIMVPPTKGYEAVPGIILQGHLDMVCVGEPSPAEAGVKPVLSQDKEWLQADGTSLGADNGIGVATAMAITEGKVEHGPLALMLTVNEEVGIEGALAMDFKTPLDNFQYLLNLDSEEEGEATISSAGGGDTLISLPLEIEPLGNKKLLTLSLEGLMGGHSGLEIGENRLNAIKVMAGVLDFFTTQTLSSLVEMNFGYARNVIPSKGEVTIAVLPELADKIGELVDEARNRILADSKHEEEKALTIKVSESEKMAVSNITPASTMKIVKLLSDLPHGVSNWSETVPGLVQTSTNLAKAKIEDSRLNIEMMTRSSIDAELAMLRGVINERATALGAEVKQLPPYPGWPAQPDSHVIELANTEWQKISGEDLKIIAVHAGLECGAIMGKYPWLEAISVGPTIKGAHSVEERVKIDSVNKFYRLVRGLVQAIAREK